MKSILPAQSLSLPLRLLAACALLLMACSESASTPTAKKLPAQTLLTNGKIYTLDSANPWAQAIAITDGTIIAIGANEKISELAGSQTNVIDLDGSFAMPGIIDAHAHPAWGGLISNYYCLFEASESPEAIATKIESCVAGSPSSETWIQGGLWAATFFEEYGIDNPRLWLDAISGDKAIALRDDSGHNYWVNSAGLELLRITLSSQAPAGAIYGTDAHGELDGVLYEAFAQVVAMLPEWTVEHYRTGVAYAVANANQYGVTGFKDASASEAEVRAYYQADLAGELTVNVATCLFDTDQQRGDAWLKNMTRMRDEYASEHVHTHFAKFFLDGIPTTSKTAAMVAPYTKTEEDEADNFGPLHVAQNALNKAVIALDAEGFIIKIHAAGDRSVHVGLNAIAAAREANQSSARHELAHAGYIDDQDLPRFAELNAVADLSPHLWFPSPIVSSIWSALGPRGREYWPVRDLIDSGAPLLMGSDWPSVAPDLNPWIGVEALITRADPYKNKTAGLANNLPETDWPEQAITLAEALRIATIDGAIAMDMASSTGSLEVGKSADLIVLNHNLFDIQPSQIAQTKVKLTLFEGQTVYEEGAL